MSIETSSQSPALGANQEKHRSKSSKKDKSSHGEKKRKYDGDDSEKPKSKKRKSHTADSDVEMSRAPEIMTPGQKKSKKSKKPRAESVEDVAEEAPKTKKPKKHRAESVEASQENKTLKKKPKKHQAEAEIMEVVPEETPKTKKKHKSSAPEVDGYTKSKKSHKSKDPLPEIPQDESPFHLQTSSLFLGLAPVSQKTPLEGLCAEHISPLILHYYPPFEGILLSYTNPRISERPFGDDGPQTLLANIDEYAVSWAWLTAEFMIFRPEKGVWLEGHINMHNEGHIGVVCWNLFNASIERKRLPSDWKWKGVEDEEGDGYAEDGAGYWVNGEGEKVDGKVSFRVKDVDKDHDKERGYLSIQGTMLDVEAEKDLLYAEKMDPIGPKLDARGRVIGGSKAPGATQLGIPREVDPLMAPKRKPVQKGTKW